MGVIKEYKEYYIVYLKDDSTVEISTQGYEVIKNQLFTPGSSFIEIDGQMYNKFEIRKILKAKADNDIDAYILKQPKNTRDAINRHSKDNNIIWKSITHVSNFIESLEEKKRLAEMTPKESNEYKIKKSLGLN